MGVIAGIGCGGGKGAGTPQGQGGAGSLTLTLPTEGSGGGRPVKYDDAGNPTCVNIASIGSFAHYGTNGKDSTDAFVTWLNAKSSATVAMFTTKPALTAEFLNNYDVILLQELGANGGKTAADFWTFSQAELDALAAWVNAGGGLISLTGYDSVAPEVAPENALLKFSGISYSTTDIMGDGLCKAIAAISPYCDCWGDAVPVTGWDPASPLSAHLTAVGAFHGFNVVPGDASVVASSGSQVFAASKQVGLGRVFVFFDEWVTYTSQWNAPATSGNCQNHTAAQQFQVPQFWYNVLSWTSNRQCFTIADDQVIPK